MRGPKKPLAHLLKAHMRSMSSRTNDSQSSTVGDKAQRRMTDQGRKMDMLVVPR